MAIIPIRFSQTCMFPCFGFWLSVQPTSCQTQQALAVLAMGGLGGGGGAGEEAWGGRMRLSRQRGRFPQSRVHVKPDAIVPGRVGFRASGSRFSRQATKRSRH